MSNKWWSLINVKSLTKSASFILWGCLEQQKTAKSYGLPLWSRARREKIILQSGLYWLWILLTGSTTTTWLSASFGKFQSWDLAPLLSVILLLFVLQGQFYDWDVVCYLNILESSYLRRMHAGTCLNKIRGVNLFFNMHLQIHINANAQWGRGSKIYFGEMKIIWWCNLQMMQFGCNSQWAFSKLYESKWRGIKTERKISVIHSKRRSVLLSVCLHLHRQSRRKYTAYACFFLTPQNFKAREFFFLTKWEHQHSNFQWDNKSLVARRQTNTACVMDRHAVKMWWRQCSTTAGAKRHSANMKPPIIMKNYLWGKMWF